MRRRHHRQLPRRHVTSGGPAMAVVVAAVAAGVLAACSTDPDPESQTGVREACQEYHQVLNQWSAGYGAELGAVGQAAAAGDERRQETAVVVVRELFTSTADQLRDQAGQTAHEELAGALAEAADGLTEIAGQIRTYDDVRNAPELMSSGQFAQAGGRVSAICAG